MNLNYIATGVLLELFAPKGWEISSDRLECVGTLPVGACESSGCKEIRRKHFSLEEQPDLAMVTRSNARVCMQRNHHHKHNHRKYSAAGDMLTHAGIEALIASIPAAIVMTLKETVGDSLQKTVRNAITKGEQAAGEAVNATASKWKISAPVTLGAVLIVGAVAHGLWRGKRKHEERSFQEAEEERRAQRDETIRARA